MANFNFPNTDKVDENGLSGGIYILWNNQVNIQPIALSEQEIYLFVKLPISSQSFYLTVVYAKPYSYFKHALWENLQLFASHCFDPWLVLGDFNDITSPSEIFGVFLPILIR